MPAAPWLRSFVEVASQQAWKDVPLPMILRILSTCKASVDKDSMLQAIWQWLSANTSELVHTTKLFEAAGLVDGAASATQVSVETAPRTSFVPAVRTQRQSRVCPCTQDL